MNHLTQIDKCSIHAVDYDFFLVIFVVFHNKSKCFDFYR